MHCNLTVNIFTLNSPNGKKVSSLPKLKTERNVPVNQLINTQFSSTTTTTNVKGIIWGNLPQIEIVGPLTKLRIINM